MADMQITIDGPAASGKSSVARRLAERLGACYVNTGDMYRAVTWAALERGVRVETDPDAVVRALEAIELRWELDAAGNLELRLNGSPAPQERIRSPEVARVVSFAAKIPAVRSWMRPRQRETARLGTVVMEGRDIGTVIFPDATHKFFITASPEVRARRRLAQPGEAAPDATLQSVAREIAERDRIDSTREVAPLKPAEDAVVLNTDDLTIDQVVDRIVAEMRGNAPS